MSDQPNSEALLALAGTVHTYESFGRAIVADALAQAAAGKLDDGESLAASVGLRPRSSQDNPPPPPVGGAAGEYHENCDQIFIVIGDGPAHEIRICWPF